MCAYTALVIVQAPGLEIVAEVPAFPSSRVGPYRRAHYLSLPDEPRCELLNGRLYRMAPPRPLHQIVAFVLWQRLDAQAVAHGGLALGAPVAITLSDHSVVQPDVIYLARRVRSEEIEGEIDGLPDLVVEVLSPGSVRRDRGEKLHLYAAAGVAEYWIVDPAARQIDFLILPAGARRFRVALAEEGVYRSGLLSEISLDIADLWREVDLRIGK
jgi:Uma2 family endonuclease